MALCRVYGSADGSLRIVHPKEALREDGEADADFLERVCALTVERDPTLAGLPYVDVDVETLPDRAERNRWRVRKGKVVVG